MCGVRIKNLATIPLTLIAIVLLVGGTMLWRQTGVRQVSLGVLLHRVSLDCRGVDALCVPSNVPGSPPHRLHPLRAELVWAAAGGLILIVIIGETRPISRATDPAAKPAPTA